MKLKIDFYANLLRVFIAAFLLILTGCTWFDDTPEQRQRRMERRRKAEEERRKDTENPTLLSGLNSTEMDAIRKSNKPRQESDVFSVRSKNNLGANDDLESLNESDLEQLKILRQQNQRQKKRNDNWVY